MSAATWLRCVGLCCFAVMLAALVPGWSQEQKGKKYALLVGVNKYDSGKLTKLKYAQNDVEKLAEILRDKDRGGFDEVRVLSNAAGKKDRADAPTAKNVREALQALVKRKKAGDLILVALSGHGLQLEVADPDEAKTKNKPKTYSYFCPVDADFTDAVSYSTGRCESLLHVKELFEALDNCGAGARLVLMDCCRNEFKAQNASRSLDVDGLRVPKGVGVLFGCDAGQRAFEAEDYKHGVFFHFVLEALRGKANKDAKEVTWDELVTYVKREVSETVPTLIGKGAKQEPHFVGSLKGRSPVLARLDAAGKVDPVGTWKCEYEIGDQKRTTELTIKKDTDKLAGTMSWPDQKGEKLKDVKLKDGTLTFSAVRKFMDTEITIEYKLKIDGDKLAGKGAAEFGGEKREFDVSGKREKKKDK
jgi:hypothetical protein